MPSAATYRLNPRSLSRLTLALGIGLVLIPASSTAQLPRYETPVAATVPIPAAMPIPAVQPPADELPVLNLGQCVAVAMERQPTLKAAYASQQSSAAGQTGLNNIGRVGQSLSKDLPIRKEQAARGQIAVAADVQKVKNELVYDVTRLYYTIVYAHQQEQIADDVVGYVNELVKGAKIQLDSKMPGDITKAKIDIMEIGLAKARTLKAKARIGQRQAYAALREAMGVDEKSFPFRVADTELPIMKQTSALTADKVVELAHANRPEMALAAAGVDAFRLEVYAQAKIPLRRAVPTFASGSDIHSRALPTGSRDENYRPEPLGPEMPTQLVGSKYDRVCRAMALSQRADAVYEKARNLIALEAENGYLNFEFAAERLALAKQGFAAAKDLKERVQENFADPRAKKDELLQGYVLASQAESEYVEAAYQYILALAALERITAGGVKPAFPDR